MIVNATLTAPTFSPADYSTNNNFLTAATTITVTAPAGSTVYYSLQNNTGTSNADLAPPNAFSPVFPAGGLVISTNCTIKGTFSLFFLLLSFLGSFYDVIA